jgi:DNA-binding IclR family transcriptional regulator
MSGRQSGAVDTALALIGTLGHNGKRITAHKAAKITGIAVSTIYRALSRLHLLGK